MRVYTYKTAEKDEEFSSREYYILVEDTVLKRWLPFFFSRHPIVVVVGSLLFSMKRILHLSLYFSSAFSSSLFLYSHITSYKFGLCLWVCKDVVGKITSCLSLFSKYYITFLIFASHILRSIFFFLDLFQLSISFQLNGHRCYFVIFIHSFFFMFIFFCVLVN